MSAVVLQRLIEHTDISNTLNTYTSVFNRFKESELEKVMEYYKTNSFLLLSKFRLCNTKTYLLFYAKKFFMGNSSPYPL